MTPLVLLLSSLLAQAPAPCGVYVGSEKALFKSLEFGDGNHVELDASLLKAQRTYFVEEGRIHVRTDKGFVTFRSVDEKTLKGEGQWVEGEKWVRSKRPPRSCRSAGATAPEKSVLQRDRCAFEADQIAVAAATSPSTPPEEAYARCCALEDGASCNREGMIRELRGDKTRADKLYLRACDLKEGAGCGNAAKLRERSGNKAEAKGLLKRGCDLKHLDSCLALDD